MLPKTLDFILSSSYIRTKGVARKHVLSSVGIIRSSVHKIPEFRRHSIESHRNSRPRTPHQFRVLQPWKTNEACLAWASIVNLHKFSVTRAPVGVKKFHDIWLKVLQIASSRSIHLFCSLQIKTLFWKLYFHRRLEAFLKNWLWIPIFAYILHSNFCSVISILKNDLLFKWFFKSHVTKSLEASLKILILMFK